MIEWNFNSGMRTIHKYRKSSNKCRVSIKRRGVKVTNVLIDISIQLFTQLNLTLTTTTLAHRDSTKRRGYLPIVRINAGGVY